MTAYEMRIGDWSSDVCASDLVPAAGEAVEHVADVANQRAGQRRRGDPALGRLYLQAAVRVLGQQRAQAVVAVLADAPVLLTIARRRRGGIAEDAAQPRRLGGGVRLEAVGSQPEAAQISRAPG